MTARKVDSIDALGSCLSGIVLFLFSGALWTAVTMHLYGWFILPIWPTLPALTFFQMYGIRVFFATFSVDIPHQKDNDLSYTANERICIGMLVAVFLWVVGFIVHSFLM